MSQSRHQSYETVTAYIIDQLEQGVVNTTNEPTPHPAPRAPKSTSELSHPTAANSKAHFVPLSTSAPSLRRRLTPFTAPLSPLTLPRTPFMTCGLGLKAIFQGGWQ